MPSICSRFRAEQHNSFVGVYKFCSKIVNHTQDNAVGFNLENMVKDFDLRMELLKLCRSKQRADREPQRTLDHHSTMPMLHTASGEPIINQKNNNQIYA